VEDRAGQALARKQPVRRDLRRRRKQPAKLIFVAPQGIRTPPEADDAVPRRPQNDRDLFRIDVPQRPASADR